MSINSILQRHLGRLQLSTGRSSDELLLPLLAFASLYLTPIENLAEAREDYEQCSELIGRVLAESDNVKFYETAARARGFFEGTRVQGMFA